jgi:hypothetical protein
LRLAQLLFDLSSDKAPGLVSREYEHYSIAGLANARGQPGNRRAPQDRKIKLRRKLTKPP